MVVALIYLGLRFTVTGLPDEGCSPVMRLQPGDWLLVDLRPGSLEHGDALLFSDGEGELLLGLLGPVPATAPAEHLAAVEAGDLWIVADNPNCPARDSRALGPIPAEQLRGRIVLGL